MSERRKLRFTLQAIHPEYACPAFETRFETDRLEELRTLLGPDAATDPDFAMIYWLEPKDIAALDEHFGVRFDAGDRDVALFKFDEESEFPYLIHTNYELPLMLDGRKKLANMYHDCPPDRHFHEDQFDRFVADGLLHKEVVLEPFDPPIDRGDGHRLTGLRTALYTPKGEEWRIAAFRLLQKASAKGGWNDTLERLEGMLYGYEEWQNDWWEEYRRARKDEFGTILLFVALSEAELVAVEQSGFRSLPPLDRDPLLLMSDDGTRAEGMTTVCLRVKTLPFSRLVADPREAFHTLHRDQVKELNALILGSIEVV